MLNTRAIVIALVVVMLLAVAYFVWRGSRDPNAAATVINTAGKKECAADTDCGANRSCVRGGCVPGVILTVTDVSRPIDDPNGFKGTLLVTAYGGNAPNAASWLGKPVTVATASLGVFATTVARLYPMGTPNPGFVSFTTAPGTYFGTKVYAPDPTDTATIDV